MPLLILLQNRNRSGNVPPCGFPLGTVVDQELSSIIDQEMAVASVIVNQELSAIVSQGALSATITVDTPVLGGNITCRIE